MSSNTSKKLILVVGATGAQGLAVIDALLKPAEDGSPSPYAIRALTRDPESSRAKELAAKGVELFKGNHDDLSTMLKALTGVYGAWINTDSFTIGEEKEMYLGMRIFELAKLAGTVRHYIWSNLDYALKKDGYDPKYSASHYNGKGRVADWLKAQPSVVSDSDLSWSVVTSGPYMEMLDLYMFGPHNKRADGTYVFSTPIGQGHVPMIALSDLGFFARYTFDHRAETSGRDLEVASDWVGWDYLAATFTKVTGKRAVVLHRTFDEWASVLDHTDQPVANERGPTPDGSWTWAQNFRCWWQIFHDDLVTRDWEWIRRVNPKGHTLESFIRENNFTGDILLKLVLKNAEDGKTVSMNRERASQL